MLDAESASRVTEILSRHFGLDAADCRLRVKRSNLLGWRGKTTHCDLTLICDTAVQMAFGKVIPHRAKPVCHTAYGDFTADAGTEYANLCWLAEAVPDEKHFHPSVIGLVPAGEMSLLLLERLSGYRNLSSMLSSRLLPRPGRVPWLIELGGRVLARLAEFQAAYSESGVALPKAECAAIRRRLESVMSLPAAVRDRLLTEVEALEENLGPVRKGILHGDLGPRNIEIGPEIAFLDWEAMRRDGLLLYDAAYFVVTFLTRCVQMCLSRSQLEHIAEELWCQLPTTGRAGDGHTRLAQLMALCHVLSAYERDSGGGGLRPILKQRRRQISFLVSQLSREGLHGQQQ